MQVVGVGVARHVRDIDHRHRRLRDARQVDLNGGPGVFCRIDAHAATGLLGKTEHLRQTQPRTLAHRLGGEEWLEGLGQHFVAHAAA